MGIKVHTSWHYTDIMTISNKGKGIVPVKGRNDEWWKEMKVVKNGNHNSFIFLWKKGLRFQSMSEYVQKSLFLSPFDDIRYCQLYFYNVMNHFNWEMFVYMNEEPIKWMFLQVWGLQFRHLTPPFEKDNVGHLIYNKYH